LSAGAAGADAVSLAAGEVFGGSAVAGGEAAGLSAGAAVADAVSLAAGTIFGDALVAGGEAAELSLGFASAGWALAAEPGSGAAATVEA